MDLPDINDLIGVPFADRGRDLDGLDCWGLLRVVYQRMGIDLPSHAEAYQTAADRAEITALVEGDLPSWREVSDERTDRCDPAQDLPGDRFMSAWW